MSDTLDRSNQSLNPASTSASASLRATQSGLEKVLVVDTAGIANLKANTNGLGYATGAGSTGTEVSNAVTVNALCGTITTASLTTAAGGEYVITVTNSFVAATDTPIVAIKATSSAGTPSASVTAVAAGSFVITLTNLHASSAFNNTMTINFSVLKAVAA